MFNLSFLQNGKKLNTNISSIAELTEACKVIEDFEPQLEDQLHVVEINNIVPNENFRFSFEKHNIVKSVMVCNLKELISLVKYNNENDIKFFPPLFHQLIEGGGWDDQQIEHYQSFVEAIQKELPADPRFTKIEKIVDNGLHLCSQMVIVNPNNTLASQISTILTEIKMVLMD